MPQEASYGFWCDYLWPITTIKIITEQVSSMDISGADPGFGQGGSPASEAKRGAQLLRPKVANVAKQSHLSKVSNLWPGSRAHLRALEAFGFLMLKYAFSHILETLFLKFFYIYFNTRS